MNLLRGFGSLNNVRISSGFQLLKSSPRDAPPSAGFPLLRGPLLQPFNTHIKHRHRCKKPIWIMLPLSQHGKAELVQIKPLNPPTTTNYLKVKSEKSVVRLLQQDQAYSGKTDEVFKTCPTRHFIQVILEKWTWIKCEILYRYRLYAWWHIKLRWPLRVRIQMTYLTWTCINHLLARDDLTCLECIVKHRHPGVEGAGICVWRNAHREYHVHTVGCLFSHSLYNSCKGVSNAGKALNMYVSKCPLMTLQIIFQNTEQEGSPVLQWNLWPVRFCCIA